MKLTRTRRASVQSRAPATVKASASKKRAVPKKKQKRSAKPKTKRQGSTSRIATDDVAPFVINPHSGRWIVVEGATYKRIEKDLSARQRTSMMQTLEYRERPSRASKSNVPVRGALLSDIFRHKTSNIEDLETTLRRTTQPSLRRRLKVQMKRQGEKRGSRTRGWAARAPQRGRARHILREQCGDSAFLMPKAEKFPIMAKCGDGYDPAQCKCEIDCGGVQSALIRARQWKYDEVAQAAEHILSLRCPPRKRKVN